MKITFLRQEKQDDEYRTLFEYNGFQVNFIPVLTSAFCNLEQLGLKSHNEYSGLIITSQIAAQAIPKSWKGLVFCVGKATAKVLHQGLEPRGESGNAVSLASFIVDLKSELKKPLLFLTGDKTLGTIHDQLRQHEIPFETLQVYETKALEQRITDDGYTVLFSPSGFDGLTVLKQPIWIAIGPTTSAFLKSKNIPHFIATEPSPLGILTAIRESG
jgi:uroporphyrinogen-III synthase